jgi:basic membrane lipoprotein Med (substrate-binding protein (PBP1-ABC) superfamily)
MNMIIGSNTVYYNFMVALAPQFPNIHWVTSRIPTRLNSPVPANTVWLHYYEHIVWFLKGVLAAKVSTNSSQFVISIPRFEGIFVVPTNFYYAGLKYVNPDAKLTAIVDPGFGEKALTVINFAINSVPYWEVYASFTSWTHTPGNLTLFNKLEIGNLISVNTAQSDKDVMLTPTTLTTTTFNVVPLWKQIVLKAMTGEDLTRYFVIAAEAEQNNNRLVDINYFSSLVPNHVKQEVQVLKTLYLQDLKGNRPSIMCQDFLVNIMKQIHPLPNGCIEPIQQIEGQLLHPDIPFLNAPV